MTAHRKLLICKLSTRKLNVTNLEVVRYSSIRFYSSSPDSLSAERGDNKSPGTNASPAALYKLTVPLLRCEAVDVRDAAVQAIGKVNADALK